MIIESGNRKRIVVIESRSPGKHVFSKIFLPRLGVVLLGTILKKKYDVAVMIENFQELDWKIIKEADIVVISIITCTASRGYEIAQKCRLMGKRVIIGGSHATFMWQEAILYADYVCRGEAEKSLPDLIDAIFFSSGDFDFGEIGGLVYKNVDGEIFSNKINGFISVGDLNNMPFPDFSLIAGQPKIETTPIITSRGCPHNCDFCSVIPMFGQEMRYRSVDNVIEEIKYQNPKRVFFYDDNFVVDKKRAAEILERMIRLGRRISWSAQVTVKVARDKEFLALMKRSGCHYVCIGFESVNKETLVAYNKKQSIEQLKESACEFKRFGINVHGMFVLDPRNDDAKVIQETYEFAVKNKISTVQFLNLTPLPGSDLWPKTEKDLITRDWSKFDGHHVVLSTRKMTEIDMQIKTIKAMEKFYSLPRALKGFLTHGLTTGVFRLVGRSLVGKWTKDNKEFLDFLRDFRKQ